MPRKTLARQVLLAKSTGKQSRDFPRTKWSDFMTFLCPVLSVEPAKPFEVAVGHKISRVLIGLLAPRPSPEE